MKKIKKAILLTFVLFTMLILTSCKGDEISKESVSITYTKRIESIEIKNETKGDIYVSFNVVLLDKEKEALFKEYYKEKYIEEKCTINLEDVKPDWIEYDKIDSMDIELIKVYEYSIVKDILMVLIILVGCVVFILFLIGFISL